MFGGKGAKSITPRAPLPPSYKTAASPKPNDAPYNESAILNSPNAPPRKRKQGQASITDSKAIWNRLEQLKTMLNRQTLHDAQTPSLIRMNQELRTEIAQLQEQHASLQKKYEELDSEVASLRQAQVNADDSQDVELVDIRDNIADLENRMDFVERGKDDDEFIIRVKDVVLEEMGARIKGH
ncbi:hypothetical protein SNK03_010169 [Fusarium graminearum]|uniref:Chromosome 4, complete genome n=1 Tax=Gibberella zeae (strain ATCC MYA-4620 / CBS 123657 / FGSC 9075 / NRRL 31084 / PH-1) TaxID=229533 RepID=I1S9K3_GIBZE|nr:hypothetical protein FGSG_13534 [Fusarium graminearum PH-1]ESU15785.1 hypothetical protein FGSG_13534 [Fusarium graminearum PH-1]CEF83409.1 unnamed protein product [Fusarium graminearum]CZS74702.1 unnamed protein product [Fusarium graminearum]|eukprot:XP_011328531.1 hypothetical protein FGSG_13534 [Fusarium graminearum PH-1]